MKKYLFFIFSVIILFSCKDEQERNFDVVTFKTIETFQIEYPHNWDTHDPNMPDDWTINKSIKGSQNDSLFIAFIVNKKNNTDSFVVKFNFEPLESCWINGDNGCQFMRKLPIKDLSNNGRQMIVKSCLMGRTPDNKTELIDIILECYDGKFKKLEFFFTKSKCNFIIL